MRKSYCHYLGLAFAIALGTAIRLWNLDLKPLWLDEVITALFALGRNYNDVPLEQLLPLDALKQIFTLNPATTCAQIAHNLATQSTHPPLFFCLMNGWVKTLGTDYSSLSTKLRSLPALFGVGAIAAIYFLNRITFSKASGLIAATVMAVSPFGVYLSQEARHYTLPILLITLSLLGLIQIQKDLFQQRLRLLVWLGWVAVNSIGFYIHYFFILAFIAQIVTLIGLFLQAKAKSEDEAWCIGRQGNRAEKILLKPLFAKLLALTFCLLPFAFFLPWLPVLLGDTASPETDWIPQPYNIAPFYQTLAAWLLMVIALPAENQPLPIAIAAGILMLLFGLWLGKYIFKGSKKLWQKPHTHWATWTLLSFTLCVLLEFFTIVYLLRKDLTIAPRYNFIYYPAICAILGASLSKAVGEERSRRVKENALCPMPHSALLVVGILSCIFVVYGLVFQKPFNPQQVAQDMNLEPSVPLVMVVGYNDYQDIALGLSFGLALDKVRIPEKTAQDYLAFFKRSRGYQSVWQNLSKLQPSTGSKLNLWVVAPGLKQQEYPSQLALSDHRTCTLDPTGYHRIGIPYQLFRCDTLR